MQQPVYLGDKRLLLRTVYGCKLLCPSDDLSVSVELAGEGAFELPLTRFLQQNVKPGQTVVDLGAHIGYFSVLLGHLVGPTGSVFAYEAHPRSYSYLLDNLSINDMHDRAHIWNRAVYSSETTLTFYASKRFLGNSSIHSHTEEYYRHYADEVESIQLDTVVLDRHLAHLETIDLIKMDMEGGEYHAFKGMETIVKERAKMIIFEVNRNMLQKDWAPFVQLLHTYRQTYGKQFFVITSDGSAVSIDLDIVLASGSFPYVIMC